MQDRLVFVEREIPRVENAIAETEQALGNFVSAEETQRQSAALEESARRACQPLTEWEESDEAIGRAGDCLEALLRAHGRRFVPEKATLK